MDLPLKRDEAAPFMPPSSFSVVIDVPNVGSDADGDWDLTYISFWRHNGRSNFWWEFSLIQENCNEDSNNRPFNTGDVFWSGAT